MRLRLWPLLLLGPSLARAAPMTLEQAYQAALARSDLVRLADNDIARSRTVQADAWTVMGPTAIVTLAAVQQRYITINGALDPDTMMPTTQSVQVAQQLQAIGSFNQPLYRRAFFPGRRAGLAQIESSAASARRAREQLHYDVATIFLQTLKARRQLEVAHAAQDRANVQLKVATVKKSLGEVVKSAVIQAQIDVRRAERSVSDAQATLDDSAAAFEYLVGVPPPELAVPSTPVTPSFADALKSAAQRSDLRALRATAVQMREQIGVLAAVAWPYLDFQALVSEFWPQAQATVNASGFNWRVLGLLTVPLFQTGDEYAKIKLARIDALSAEMRVSLLEKVAREDVQRAAALLEARTRVLAIAEQQVVDARENYTLVQAQFKNGRGTSTDVVVAESTIAEAENQQAVAAFDRDQAAWQLLFAAGML